MLRRLSVVCSAAAHRTTKSLTHTAHNSNRCVTSQLCNAHILTTQPRRYQNTNAAALQPVTYNGQTYQTRPDIHRPNLRFTNRTKLIEGVRTNIILMGPPGSGKSTVAKILATKLQMSHIDVDDDVLEKVWNCTVAEALSKMGDTAFVAAEAAETQKLTHVKNTIISLSGSNPLNHATMEVLSKIGTIIYLDIDKQCILNRCTQMKIDRIVGQHTQSLSDILDYRRSIYESSYDIRVLVPYQHTSSSSGDTTDYSTVDAIANQVHSRLTEYRKQKYTSTRGFTGEHESGHTYEFLDAIRIGLAPDRGLFIAQVFQPFVYSQLNRLTGLSYPEVALRVLERFPLGMLHPTQLRDLLYNAYNQFDHGDILPVRHLHKHYYIAETFHGPTASFKDLSLQLLPALMHVAVTTDTSITREQKAQAKQQSNTQSDVRASAAKPRVGLLVATSGDTGTAALSGFARHAESGPVIVLYPTNGVSIVQKMQMLTSTGDVLVLGVDADFDYCQTTVKNILNDVALNKQMAEICPGLMISSANSMNFGRFVPQVVYAVYSYLQLVQQNVIKIGEPIDLTIPTGNFGNLLAAVYARQLGIPIRHLVCASNDNNVLADFIKTGRYDLRKRAFKQTVSPSIDILVSSNLERFIHMLSNGDTELVSRLFKQLAKGLHFQLPSEVFSRVQEEVKGGWCTEEECLQTIKQTYELTKQLIDPHTAVAMKVAQQFSPLDQSNHDNVPMVIMSTAHWGKFPPAMLTAFNQSVDESVASLKPNQLAGEMEKQFAALTKMPADPASYLHPQLAALVHMPIQHYNTVEADETVIVDKIKQFLHAYAQKQQVRK